MSICAQCLLAGACISISHFSLLIYNFPEEGIKIEGGGEYHAGPKGKGETSTCGETGLQDWSLATCPQHRFPRTPSCFGHCLKLPALSCEEPRHALKSRGRCQAPTRTRARGECPWREGGGGDHPCCVFTLVGTGTRNCFIAGGRCQFVKLWM